MFWDKKLKREIAVLTDENDTLRERITGLKNDVRILTERESVRESLFKANDVLLREAKAKVEDLEKKVRAQNEADLMFVSAKIIKELLKGKKLAELTDHRKLLRTQAQAYQSYQGTAGPAYGAISDLLQSCGL